MIEPDRVERTAGDAFELALYHFGQATRVLETLERDRSRIHHGIDDPEATRGAAMDVAVDVDLYALERLLADEVMCVADIRAGHEIAHQIVERLHQASDDVFRPRSELEMADELCGALHAARQYRVRRLDRLHEQRVRELFGGRMIDGPRNCDVTRRCVGQRGTGQLPRQDLVLRTHDRERIGAGKAEFASEPRRDQRAVLLVGADHARDAGASVLAHQAIEIRPRIEPEDSGVLGKTRKVEAVGNDLELGPEWRDAAQSAAVPALGKQKEELGSHPAA